MRTEAKAWGRRFRSRLCQWLARGPLRASYLNWSLENVSDAVALHEAELIRHVALIQAYARDRYLEIGSIHIGGLVRKR